MRISANADIIDFDPYSTRTQDPGTHGFGDRVDLADGRTFRHGKAGGSNISRGKLQLAPAPKSNHQDCATVLGELDAFQVTITLDATAAVAGEYDEGFAVVIDGTGEGQVLSISHNPAADSAANIVIKLADAIQTALASSDSKVCLTHNTWNGVVEGTSSTRAVAGVPLISVTAGDYAWFQTKGIAAVLADEALTVGTWLTAGTSTAGAVEELDDVTAPITDNLVGFVQYAAGTDTEYPVAVLCID